MTTQVAAIAVAELVSVTAASVAGVVAVAPEPGHSIATYGPGRRVPGVQVQRRPDGDRILVHVTAALGTHLPTLADEVRAALGSALADNLPEPVAPTIDVHIAQLVDPRPGQEGLP